MASASKDRSAGPAAHHIFVSRRFVVIAVFALGWSVVAVALGLMVRGTPAEQGMSALVKAYRPTRPIEPRLSGGLAAAGFDRALRGPSNASSPDRDTAAELLAEVATQRDDGYAQLAYGRFLLTELRASDALKRFRQAVERLPRSADAFNDYGACLLEQGKAEDALEKLNRALEIDSKMPEALFNRALCYERLLLTDAAAAELTALLSIERDPGWRNEILVKARAIRGEGAAAKMPAEIVASFDEAIENQDLDEAGRIAHDNLEVINKYAVEIVPRKFLKASRTGDADKMRRALFKIKFAGKQLLASTGDTSTSDLAAYMAQLSERERASELALLKEYKRADKKLAARKYGEALLASERAEEEFAERGNLVYRQFAGYIVANSLYGAVELDRAKKKLGEILDSIEHQSWPYRRAQSLALLGVTHSRLGNDSQGLEDCEKARRFGSGLPQLEAKACQYLSSVYFRLGDLDKRLEYLRKSTKFYLSGGTSSTDLASNFADLASSYSIRSNHELALLYAQQSLSYARLAGDNSRAAQAASMAAVELAKLGRFKRAEEELNRALTYVELIVDAPRQFTESRVRRLGGELKLEQGNISQALDYYNEAEVLAKTSEDNALPLIRVLRGRAEAYIKAEEFEKARMDLDRAASHLQQYRERIEERTGRSDFLDANSSVFDQLIELDAGILGRCNDAFDMLEQSRARALLDEFQSAEGGGKPLQLKAITDSLPADLKLLVYSVTSGGTYIFLVTSKGGCTVTRTPATTERLDRLVHDYVLAIKNRESTELLREKGRDLYDRLIAPVQDKLGETDLLCIVPDKALHFLPFAALVDPSDRYLIASRRLIYAPSASVLVQCIKASGLKGPAAPESILTVGNPTPNRDAFPDLEDLPDAGREAKAIADQYDPKGRTILIGPDATKERVLSALGRSDVVHLATHCVIEGNASWLAALVLAEPPLNRARELSSSIARPGRSRNAGNRGPGVVTSPKSTHLGGPSLTGDRGEGGDVVDLQGLLRLDHIYESQLARTRIVVLSACQTGLGQYFRGEGIVSLVRPFLAKGVPTVVASLWSVESTATADLMIDFHKQRRAGGTGGVKAADALREAQISMSQSVLFGHPYYWAAFIAVGANQ